MSVNDTAAAVVCQVDHGDTSWVLISTVLVLGMSPALAFFEAGMLRSKNTLSIVTQIFSGVITLSVMWVLFGYSLTFGPTQGGFIGGLHYGAFVDVSYFDCVIHAPKIPSAAFAMFQMMFAVITPLLITGAYAERMKFKVYFIFTVVWEIVVYYPVAHWIWGDGFFSTWGPVLDFAGGIVIHTSAGAASIVSAIMLGRRQEFEHYHGEFPPSNLPLAATGAALLWIGWFGFNGGSALGAGPVAVSAVVSSQVGCSMSAVTWLFLAWYRDSPSTTALMNGALAGLAGITPASGYINTQASIVVGFVLGIASYVGCIVMKQKFHIDDALDVSMVHGLTGVIGSLAVGIFSDHTINPDGKNGWWYGNPAQLGYQVVGVLTVGVYAAVWTFIILKVLSYIFGGLRISEAEERMGVDWTEHKEIAYHKLHVLDDATTREYVDQHYEDHHISSDDDDITQILQHRHNATNGQLQGDAPNSVTDNIVAPVPISAQLSRPLLRQHNTPSPSLSRSDSMNSLPHNEHYRRKTPVPGSPGSPQHGGTSASGAGAYPPPLTTSSGSGTRGTKRGEA